MKTASVAELKSRFDEFVKASRAGPVVVTRNGRAVAVLLAVTDEDELERLMLAHSPKLRAIIERSRRDIEETGGLSHEQFWREVAAERRKKAGKDGANKRGRGVAPSARPDGGAHRGRPVAAASRPAVPPGRGRRPV